MGVSSCGDAFVKLRFGMVGLGVAGGRRLAILAKSDKVVLTAAVDFRREARERFELDFGGKTYTTVEDLCASSDVDAVWIATPTELHRDHVLVAAARGKHVILEKPMALTLEECDQMNEAVERFGVRFI